MAWDTAGPANGGYSEHYLGPIKMDFHQKESQ
jgi:hypothetical protein